MKVYQKKGERFSQAFIEKTVEYGDASCMFWGVISINGKTEPVCVFRTGGVRGQWSLNTHRYITEILEEHVVPYAGFVGDIFTLTHDNSRFQTTIIVRIYTGRYPCYTVASEKSKPQHNWVPLGWFKTTSSVTWSCPNNPPRPSRYCFCGME